MPQLSLNYFDGLEILARNHNLDFQYVRVGSWFDGTKIEEIIARFPGKRFLYHHNRNIRADRAKTRALIATLQAQQRRTASPWLSAHLDQHTDDEMRALLRDGIAPPCYDTERSFQMICDAFRTLQARLPVPLLLENVPHWPLPEPDVAIMPDFVRRVQDATKCDLVLDTAHAQITAHRLSCDVRDYLKALPLNRVVEIHVAGPRYRQGQLVDVHETLREEDFDLLGWLLEQTAPQAVTLECSKAPTVLLPQIVRIGNLLRAQ